TLKFSTAAQLRDAAAAKFDEAIALATANVFTVPAEFFGSPSQTYTNVQIVQIANTMAARNLAYFARSAAQTATVDWAKVAGYAKDVIDAYPDTHTVRRAGYDYVWVKGQEFGNKTRGSWHQSAIGQIRYDSFPGCGDNPAGTLTAGALDGPMVLAAENDLIW